MAFSTRNYRSFSLPDNPPSKSIDIHHASESHRASPYKQTTIWTSGNARLGNKDRVRKQATPAKKYYTKRYEVHPVVEGTLL